MKTRLFTIIIITSLMLSYALPFRSFALSDNEIRSTMLEYCYLNQAYNSGYEVKNGSDNFVTLDGDNTSSVNNFNFYSEYKKYRSSHSDADLEFTSPDECILLSSFLTYAQEICPEYNQYDDWSDYFDLYIVVKYSSSRIQVVSSGRYIRLSLYMFFVPKNSRIGVNVDDETYSIIDLATNKRYYYVLSNNAYISCYQDLIYEQPNPTSNYAAKSKVTITSPVLGIRNSVSNSSNFYVNFGNPSTLGEGDRCEIYYTNIPAFLYGKDCQNYIDTGDDTGVLNKISGADTNKVGCDSFYWDSMTCKVSEASGSDVSKVFSLDYNYSVSDMVNNPQIYIVNVQFIVSLKYKTEHGLIKEYKDNFGDTFLLSDYKKSYTTTKNLVNSSTSDNTFWDKFSHIFGSFFDAVIGCVSFGRVDAELREIDEDLHSIEDFSIYVNVFLKRSSLDVTNGSDVKHSMITSSDVRLFKFDFLTLEEETIGQDIQPTVNTEEVKDDEGNVVDKKVTSVVGNDGGQTVVNITIDNTNTNTNNNTGGSGSSGSDAEDVLSFWQILSKLGDTIKGLFTGSSGMFAFIKAFFDFIPPEFWTVVIAIVVIIGVVAIFKLVKSVV